MGGFKQPDMVAGSVDGAGPDNPAGVTTVDHDSATALSRDATCIAGIGRQIFDTVHNEILVCPERPRILPTIPVRHIKSGRDGDIITTDRGHENHLLLRAIVSSGAAFGSRRARSLNFAGKDRSWIRSRARSTSCAAEPIVALIQNDQALIGCKSRDVAQCNRGRTRRVSRRPRGGLVWTSGEGI